ncbi:MAG: HIT domain-containing protein [Candidatus Nitrosocaldus sp.]|nr:HIT domain-containing protein [Candidatus Nitrosocaldus sp.]MDW8275975.1 HIT domain-containing protein [Candidatus Nitrosocaldus sp.]
MDDADADTGSAGDGGGECVFCLIAEGRKEAAVVYEDGSMMAFMDKYPISTGHTLVIPKRHYATILEMDGKDVGMLFALAHRVAKAAVRALNAQGFSIAQNNGKVAHQVVPHVHVHIVPRFIDEERSRWPSRRTASMDELRAIAMKIRQQLDTRSDGADAVDVELITD